MNLLFILTRPAPIHFPHTDLLPQTPKTMFRQVLGTYLLLSVQNFNVSNLINISVLYKSHHINFPHHLIGLIKVAKMVTTR